MKKIISALFIGVFVMSMTACDSNSTSSDAEQMTETQENTGSEAMGSKVSSEEAQNAWANFGSSDSADGSEEETGNQ